MALELEFIVDTEGLQLDEVLPLSDLLELEVLFEETLDFEMEIVVTVDSRVHTDSTLSGSGTVSDPLTINILGSPEFADTQIQGLKSDANGGSVADADYNWFKGVYASLVDGSVLSWIKGLVNQVKSLATRVGVLEDQYILKYVVPIDTNKIILNSDKNGNAFNFAKGETIRITIKIESFVGNLTDRANLRINDIAFAKYISIGTLLTFIGGCGSAYYGQYTTWTITINDGEITGQTSASIKAANTTTWSHSQVYDFKSIGLNVNKITSLTIFSFSAGNVIPAGTIIEITK